MIRYFKIPYHVIVYFKMLIVKLVFSLLFSIVQIKTFIVIDHKHGEIDIAKNIKN